MRLKLLVFLLAAFSNCRDGTEVMFSPNEDMGEQLGSVEFSTSCDAATATHIEQGVALLHHMTYEGAEHSFQAALEIDSECAMAHWGVAMSFIHPLWADVPDQARLEEGLARLSEARSRGEKTAREQAYIAAVEAYYRDGTQRDERDRLLGFDEAWRTVYEQFPEDLEAASFYALAHMATALPGDKSYGIQREAGEIVERVLSEIPDHPGAHHYIIHAYDYPGLAEKALAVARNYGKVAPELPHALHMPTHIFTRLGLWQESIDWNIRSATAALERPVNEEISHHYFHALDYLAYAYLQRAEDDRAKSILADMRALRGRFQSFFPAAYTLAAVPARYALERRQWTEAAGLKPRQPAHFSWERFPEYEAITYFARALGAARSRDLDTAQSAIARLAELQDQIRQTASNEYWAAQVEIQRNSALAWLRFAQGRTHQALELMQSAATMEAATHKHPVTPGEVIPARELLADLLLELGKPEEALTHYELSLKRSPRRLNGLYGAGRAAELMGDPQRARSYYGQLMELTAAATPGREQLAQVREYLRMHE